MTELLASWFGVSPAVVASVGFGGLLVGMGLAVWALDHLTRPQTAPSRLQQAAQHCPRCGKPWRYAQGQRIPHLSCPDVQP